MLRGLPGEFGGIWLDGAAVEKLDGLSRHQCSRILMKMLRSEMTKDYYCSMHLLPSQQHSVDQSEMGAMKETYSHLGSTTTPKKATEQRLSMALNSEVSRKEGSKGFQSSQVQ
jgi:hypothetical protein